MNVNKGQAKHKLFLRFWWYGCVLLFQALDSKPEAVCVALHQTVSSTAEESKGGMVFSEANNVPRPQSKK